MKLVNSNNLNTRWGRMEKFKQNLRIKYSTFSKTDTIGNLIKKQIRGKYETLRLSKIN